MVAYPEGMLCDPIPCVLQTYDLKRSLPSPTGTALSNAGFPTGPDPVGPPLPASLGDLILNQQNPAVAYFEAQVLSSPFASLHASAHAFANANRFAMFAMDTSVPRTLSA